MPARTAFFSELERVATAKNSLLCVGLDPAGHATAAEALAQCERLVDETHAYCCAFKPNVAFFERFHAEGATALGRLCAKIRAETDCLVVLDAKRGDIGNTAEAYAASAQDLGDCVTLNAYMGHDSVEPFLREVKAVEGAPRARGVFVLAKTSNPGSNDFQTLECGDGRPLYLHVTETALSWGAAERDIGFVVGATDDEAVSKIRRQHPEVWFLSPGIGAQGGDLGAAVRNGVRRSDKLGMLIPISRGITRAEDWRKAAKDFRDAINQVTAAME